MTKLKKGTGVVDALSKVSGLSSVEIRDIAKQIKKNHELLDSCSFHEFEFIDDNPSLLRRVYKCKNCNGTVQGIYKIWYERGIKHAQKRKMEHER